jgi:hypothetical protein
VGPEDCRICRKLGTSVPCLPHETFTGRGCAEPEILEENVPAIELFLAVQTQWRVGFSGATGLDYAGVEAAARLRGTALTADTFDRLQVLERAWLAALGDVRERGKPPTVEAS